ncbi:MAG TPA: MarR family transcriptional regulator [Paenalcaligenes sp.]|nr:MarR family transcriptional regulator [Paenalcaligenes sp.]
MSDFTTTTSGDLLDLESRVTNDNSPCLRLLLRLLSCSTVIENEIRSRLRRKFHITLPRFSLLAQLSSVRGGLSMSELSQRMLVTNGNITGIVDHLEQHGLIERIQHISDRRCSLIRLTNRGRRCYKEMADSYELWIAELFEPLSINTRTQLLAGLDELRHAAFRFSPSQNRPQPQLKHCEEPPQETEAKQEAEVS